MRKRPFVIAGLMAAGLVVLAAAGLQLLIFLFPYNNGPWTFASPSGSYEALAYIRRNPGPAVILQIFDARGELITEQYTGASSRMRWWMAWDDADRLWMKSSDIGTYYWERDADGAWSRKSGSQTVPGRPTPPPFPNP